MSLIGRLVGVLLPTHDRTGSDVPNAKDVLAAARHSYEETTQAARLTTQAVTRHRKNVEAERERIRARTEATQQKRRTGQTSHIAHAVEDALKAPSFGGSDED